MFIKNEIKEDIFIMWMTIQEDVHQVWTLRLFLKTFNLKSLSMEQKKVLLCLMLLNAES